MLEEAGEQVLAFTTFPQPVWRQIWYREAIVRLIGAVLAEYNDEWMISRRYMSVGVLKSAQQGGINEEEPEGVLVEQLAV